MICKIPVDNNISGRRATDGRVVLLNPLFALFEKGDIFRVIFCWFRHAHNDSDDIKGGPMTEKFHFAVYSRTISGYDCKENDIGSRRTTMKILKRFIPLLVIVGFVFASCSGGPTPVAGDKTPVPTVEKDTLQYLMNEANNLRNIAQGYTDYYELNDKFDEANAMHDSVSADYKTLVEDANPYDGAKAFPLKEKLEKLNATWEALIKQGAALKKAELAAAEKLAKDKAAADALFPEARARMAWATKAGVKEYYPKVYNQAQAGLVSAEKAYEAERYEASSKLMKEEVINVLNDSFKETVKNDAAAVLKDAEARIAWADEQNIKEDYPDEYRDATLSFALAESAFMNEEYGTARKEAGKASSILSDEFKKRVIDERAMNKAIAEASEASDALAEAHSRVAWAREVDLARFYPDVYRDAETSLLAADAAYSENKYAAATSLAKDVSRILSDDFQTEAAEYIAEQKKIEIEKAEAAEALAFAQARMKWAKSWLTADEQKTTYAKELSSAQASLTAAEKAFEVERYAASKTLSKEVLSTLSEDFQKRVEVDRKLKVEEQRKKEELRAAQKSAAEVAIADAEKRMAWANENAIQKDYPNEFKAASNAMIAAYVAFGTEKYVESKQKADEVSALLSDGFQTKVASERAEKLSRAKTLAANAQAGAEKSRSEVIEKGYQNYPQISMFFEMGETKLMEGKELAAAGDTASYEKAVVAFAEAKEQYEFVKAKGSEYRAFEGKDKAYAARDAAAAWKAELNAPDKWDHAVDMIGYAETSMEKGEYEAAYVKYLDAAKAFDAAQQAVESKASEVEEVIGATVQDLAAAKDRASKFGLEENIYLTAADEHLQKAIAFSNDKQLANALFEANEVRNYIGLSDTMVAEEAKIRAQAAQKQAAAPAATAEKPAQEAQTGQVAKPAQEAPQPAPQPSPAEQPKAAPQQDDEAAARIAAAQKAAEQSLAKAKDRYDWAASKNAANNYSELFKKGGEQLADAKTAFSAADYERAKRLADQAFETLASIKEFAPLPASYKVRLIPERRDCLWRIAEYPFVYNNPLKWPVLYEANKKTFKDPSNPHLIFPGQIIKIPSIKNEERVGEWDPKKTYQPLAK